MKYLLILFFIFGSRSVSGQEKNVPFDNAFHLKNGIYTSSLEILTNAPKYLGYLLDEKVGFFSGKQTFFYYTPDSDRQQLMDPLFAYVYKGILQIKYMNRFYKLILTGAISVFFTEPGQVNRSASYLDFKEKLFFVDIRTGTIDRLNPENIEEILKRDSLIYSSFSDAPYAKKKKTLYSYLLKYNMRNPVYVMERR